MASVIVCGVVINANYPNRSPHSQIILGRGTICGMIVGKFLLTGLDRHFACMQHLFAVAAESTPSPLLPAGDEIRILNPPIATATTRAVPAVAAGCLCG